MIQTATEYLKPLAQADLLLMIAKLLAGSAALSDDDLAGAEEDAAELIERANLGSVRHLREALLAALADARATDRPAWRAEHTRLFEGATPCPINETAYVRRDKGALLADICGFYEAFGFLAAQSSCEKPDHVICELEFVAVLLVMLARAEMAGETERARVTGDALRSFLADHLGEWLVLFTQRLTETTTLRVYASTARLLEQTWMALADRLEIPQADPIAAPVPLMLDDSETPYECGMARPEQTVPLTGPPGSGLPALNSPGEGA